MTENKRFTVDGLTITENSQKGRKYLLEYQGGVNALCNRINGLFDKSKRLEKENKELLKYKYLTKALEEVSGSHYIEELISDFSDGSYCEDKDQIELGKWVVEHGLSWEELE